MKNKGMYQQNVQVQPISGKIRCTRLPLVIFKNKAKKLLAYLALWRNYHRLSTRPKVRGAHAHVRKTRFLWW